MALPQKYKKEIANEKVKNDKNGFFRIPSFR
jgi:hypothetical protein